MRHRDKPVLCRHVCSLQQINNRRNIAAVMCRWAPYSPECTNIARHSRLRFKADLAMVVSSREVYFSTARKRTLSVNINEWMSVVVRQT